MPGAHLKVAILIDFESSQDISKLPSDWRAVRAENHRSNGHT